MNKILIVHTSWYEEDITKMIDISVEILEQKFTCVKAKAPGAIELAALAKSNMHKENYVGVICHGIVIRGETSHYDLVTNETFRSIGSLSENFFDIAVINNVICVENTTQLLERLEKNTRNNTNALISLINEKSC
jgi:6,7-dimethyl-8-ribityllumazine synthase|tara:strand:+ start:1792 stop:2196 length:405 start_codon:yes stop_codon:yes gene_type:complete